MTKKELQVLAEMTATELRKDCGSCPFSRMQPEQVQAVFEMANGYIIGKKTIWKTLVGILTGLLIALIGYGIIHRIVELTKK